MKLMVSLSLLLSFPLYAAQTVKARPYSSRVLKCLGKEEKALHLRKETGAVYDLNQRLIGELVLINRIDAETSLLKRICTMKGSPSIGLLEGMLISPKGWSAPASTGNGVEDSIQKGLIDDLNQGLPEILLNFLGQLQAESPNATCLNEKIPGIKSMNEEVKWLQEEVDLTKITNRKERLEKIFAGIHQVDKYFAECRAADQSRAKSKNTIKGTGKPSAK